MPVLHRTTNRFALIAGLALASVSHWAAVPGAAVVAAGPQQVGAHAQAQGTPDRPPKLPKRCDPGDLAIEPCGCLLPGGCY